MEYSNLRTIFLLLGGIRAGWVDLYVYKIALGLENYLLWGQTG